MDKNPWSFTPIPPDRYLESTVQFGRFLSIPKKTQTSFFSGYLAACSYFPDRVLLPINMNKDLVDGGEHLLVDPVSVVMALMPLSLKEATSKWPSSLSGFESLRERIEAEPDASIAAAMLLVAGADPWKDHEPGSIPDAVQKMIASPYPGLLRLALSHKNAMPVEELCGQRLSRANGKKIIDYVFEADGVSEVLSVLIDHGFRFSFVSGRNVELLSSASPQAIEVCARNGLLDDLPSAEKIQVNRAWLKRVRSSNLSSDQMERMVSHLQSDLTSMKKAQNEIDQAGADSILSVPWGTGNGRMKMTGFLGAPGLLRVMRSKTQMRGSWNVISAYCMALLRENSQVDNTIPFDFLLSPPENKVSNGFFKKINVLDERWKGCLSSALNVEWRDGVYSSAMIALSVLSAKVPRSKQIKDKQSYLDVVQHVFGIDDLFGWVASNAPQMAAITTQTMKSNARSQQAVMLSVWSRLLNEEPTWIKEAVSLGLAPRDKQELLLTLCGRFELSAPWAFISSKHQEAFQEIFNNLFSTDRDKGTPAHSAAQLILDLSDARPDKAVQTIENLSPDIPGADVKKILNAWCASRKDENDFASAIALAKSKLLFGVAKEYSTVSPSKLKM